MNYETIISEQTGKICKLTLNRPKQLNALNTQVFSDLESAINEALKNESCWVILITGSGEKAFAAGADIKEFAEFNHGQASDLSANGQRIFKLISDSPKPVLAAINGFALGGGLELAMACHLRIASTNAKFGQPEVGLGVTPGYAGTQRLTELIGRTKATEFLISGEMISAEQALALGLVNYVVNLEDLENKSLELISKITKNSPVAVAGVLKSINAYFDKKADGYQAEVDEFAHCFLSEDFKEGTQAFIERRKAEFKGK
jgi:enoyl-CoA hydratase